jgi:cholesterol oxidase
MKRRDLFRRSGLLLGATLPAAPAAAFLGPRNYSAQVPEIYAPIPRPPAHTRAIVIGTGFGGAVSALRLSQAGIDVTMLERGFEWPRDPWREIFTNDKLPDGRGFWFRSTSKTVTGLPGTPVDRFGGVMDVTEYEHIDVWRGAAVGGGSVVFTGAMPQPPRELFDAVFQGRVNYDEMDRIHYPLVRQMLRLSPMPADVYNSLPFDHSRSWDRSSRRAGYTTQPVDGIWNWDVVRSELAGRSRRSCTAGLSNLGNSNGAKFDLNQNYLAQARATGRTRVFAGHTVLNIWRDGQRWVIDAQRRHPDGRQLDRYHLTCDMLVLAAGSVGTSELLVRARALGHLPNLNAEIGRGWGSNGDSSVVRSFALGAGVGVGAACASLIRDTRGMPVTLENWFTPGLPVNFGLEASLGIALDLENRADFVYEPHTDRVRLRWPRNGNDAGAVRRGRQDGRAPVEEPAWARPTPCATSSPARPAAQRLQDELGIECVSADAALHGAQVVILAVPDTLIGRLAAEISPKLKAGTMVMTLDAAAPFAGHLPERDDLTYFVAHPCHPPIFSAEVHTPGARRLLRRRPRAAVDRQRADAGPDSAFDLGEAIAKTIYQPILRSYRLTVEQMALLEPGLSETVCATLLDVMREAMDEVVARGVPPSARATSCSAT